MTSETIREARKAITTLFYDGWGGASPLTPVSHDAQNFKTDSLDEWASIVIRNKDNSQRTLGGVGTRKFDRIGNVIVSINVRPEKIPTTRLDDLTQIALRIFEGVRIPGTSIIFNDVTNREHGVINGKFNVVVVDAEYVYNETR